MALAYNYYVGTGAQTAFAFNKELNAQATVVGWQAGALSAGTWDSVSGFFTFDVAPASGADVYVVRKTANDTAVATYPNKSYISSENLDADFRQSLMQVQELEFAIAQAIALNAGAPGYALAAAASAAAALISELAAAASETAAALSETNASASAAAALASETAAALSEAATGLDAIATAADAATTTANAIATAADAVQTASDVLATAANALAASNAATAAQASETAAGLSETAAALSETNAAASEAAAALSETAAENAAQSLIWNDVVFKAFADSPITLTEADRGVLYVIDSSGGNVLINLPSVAVVTMPFSVGIKKSSSDGNTVTVDGNGTDTIDGSGTLAITLGDSGATLVADTDPIPDEWTAMKFGASGGNITVDTYVNGVDFTAGTTTALTVSVAPGTENNVNVNFDGVTQQHTEFSLSGTTVTFTSAIPLYVTNVEIVSGATLAIGEPADASVTIPKLDTSVSDLLSRKNYIINPTFSINQRVFTGGAVSAGAYSYDRWRSGAASSITTPDVNGYVTITSGNLQQRVEPFDHGYEPTMTLSWEGTATLSDGGSQTSPYTFDSTGKWTAGSGLALQLLFEPGTIRNAKLEIGSVATPFEYPSEGEELYKCQRYFQKSFVQTTAPGQAAANSGRTRFRLGGLANTTHATYLHVPYLTTMRAVATPLLYSTATGAVGKVYDAVGAGDVTGTESNPGDTGFTMECTTATSTVIDILFQWTAEAEL